MFKKLVPLILIMLIPGLVCAWPLGWNSVGIALIGSDSKIQGHGSFVVTTKGVYSAKHLVENEDTKIVPLNFKVVKKWKNIDLIKIKIENERRFRKSPVAKYIDPGKPVYYIGYIGEDQKVVKYGYIMGKVTKKFSNEFKDHILVDTSAVPGMSGGGVFQDGKVIGIVSSTFVHSYRGSLFSVMVPLPGTRWIGE